jgi:hypothetical protein
LLNLSGEFELAFELRWRTVPRIPALHLVSTGPSAAIHA